MRLVAEDGLWTTDTGAAVPPLDAVLEVSGAVLSWTVDMPAEEPRIVFTDPRRADWLWRVVGEAGHVALLDALTRPAGPDGVVELAGVEVLPAAVSALRRLAVGHWLRRWWPASQRDGIAVLDPPVLDAELALLVAAADFAFSDDTIDADPAELLRPHAAAIERFAEHGDARVVELGRRAIELADDLGCRWSQGSAAGVGRQADYALAAGPTARPAAATIAAGTASVNWAGVPPGIFDAAEDTVRWSIEPLAGVVVARIAVALMADRADGVAVAVGSNRLTGQGVLDSRGEATVTLFDDRAAITEAAAWNQDWSSTVITVGAEVSEPMHARDRVRRFARSRLAQPQADAYLAELLAADALY